MNKIPCSVGILTLNSESTLRRCLESVKDFQEIIICDGNSTDRTLDIAKEYGCKIIKQYETDEKNISIRDFSEIRNKCLSAASLDWYLSLDSDEQLSESLKQEISEIASSNPECLIYEISSRIIYNDREIKYASSYPGWQKRFFNRKTQSYFIKPIHERLKYDEKYEVCRLSGVWYVFTSDEDYKDFKSSQLVYIEKEVKASEKQNFFQFIRWSVFNKIFRIAKLSLKIGAIYLIHGFKHTLPPKFELQRLSYVSILFFRLLKNRIFGNEQAK